MRGPELTEKIPNLVNGLINAMQGINNEQTMNGNNSYK